MKYVALVEENMTSVVAERKTVAEVEDVLVVDNVERKWKLRWKK